MAKAEDLELICVQIITNAGEARSDCMAALSAARERRYEEAEASLSAASDKLRAAHGVHTQLITLDADESLEKISLLMVHSEDIMMGTEITLSLAGEMVMMYKTMHTDE